MAWLRTAAAVPWLRTEMQARHSHPPKCPSLLQEQHQQMVLKNGQHSPGELGHCSSPCSMRGFLCHPFPWQSAGHRGYSSSNESQQGTGVVPAAMTASRAQGLFQQHLLDSVWSAAPTPHGHHPEQQFHTWGHLQVLGWSVTYRMSTDSNWNTVRQKPGTFKESDEEKRRMERSETQRNLQLSIGWIFFPFWQGWSYPTYYYVVLITYLCNRSLW